MNKKLLSITLAMLLAAAPLSVAAAADEADTAEAQGVTGTIKFDMGDWNHDDKVCFFIWDTTTNQYATKNGWQDGNTWASKKILGTPVEGEDGIVESYELTLYEGHDTFVIFHDQTTNDQTFNCVLTPAAIGHTAHMAEEKIENPVDSEKQDTAAVFDGVEGCGPQLTITSTGNVVGQYSAPNANGAATVAQYIFDRVGTVDKSGVECCTPEKVATAIEKFGTTANDVWTTFIEKFSEKEDYTDKEGPAHKVVFPDANIDSPDPIDFGTPDPVNDDTPDPEKPDDSKTVTGTIFFDMGDWNHDDNLCFYIWDATTGLNATKNGWQEGNTWGSKKLFGTPVEGKDGIVESYEFSITEGHDVFVIFHDQTTNEQTFNCVLTADAFGHTAHMLPDKIENPVDSTKQDIVAVFDDVEGCGPQLTITSIGNVVGEVLAPNTDAAEVVAQFVIDNMEKVDDEGNPIVTPAKVANALEKFKVSPEDAFAAYAKLQNLVVGTAAYQVAYNQFQQLVADYLANRDTPDPARKLGDVNGDGKVTAADAMVIQRYSVHLTQLDDEQLAAADVNGDGKVTAKDALVIQRYSIKLGKIPPERSGSVA